MYDDDDGDGIGAISLLKRMETKSSIGDAHARVSSIRGQITQDESALPVHQKNRREMLRDLKPFQRRVNEGTLREMKTGLSIRQSRRISMIV